MKHRAKNRKTVQFFFEKCAPDCLVKQRNDAKANQVKHFKSGKVKVV